MLQNCNKNLIFFLTIIEKKYATMIIEVFPLNNDWRRTYGERGE